MAVHPVRGGGGGEAGGHFRLCLLGRAQPHLLLGQDRVGVKPLFYAFQGTTLVFGSEPKALFAYPGLTPKADTESWQGGAGPVPRPDAGARRICRGAGSCGAAIFC